MYEEKRFYNKRVNWLSVFLKLLLLVLVAFLVWFVIYKHRNKQTKPKDAKPMSENLTTLKADYVKYFNEDNLPKSVNDEVRVPLEALYDETKIDTIYDKNGKECSPASSYGQLTKLENGVYKLKVYLKCKNEADSIITTLTKDEITSAKFEDKNTKKKDNTKKTDNNKDTKTNDTKKDNTNKDNTKKTDTTKTDVNKDNTKKTDTTKTDVNKDTKKTTTDTNNTNKTNTNNTNKTNTNNNVTTNNNSKTNNTSAQTNNGSGNGGVVNTTTPAPAPTPTPVVEVSKPSVEEIISDPSRIVFTEYYMIRYGNKTYTKPTSGKYKSFTDKIVYYKYCINDDLYNCPKKIAKNEENKVIIETLLQLGYKEYEYKTEYVIAYIPILDEKWSEDKNLPGYTFTGESRTHYRMN